MKNLNVKLQNKYLKINVLSLIKRRILNGNRITADKLSRTGYIVVIIIKSVLRLSYARVKPKNISKGKAQA